MGAEQVDWHYPPPGPGRYPPRFAAVVPTLYTSDTKPRPPLGDWELSGPPPRFEVRRLRELPGTVTISNPIATLIGDWGTPQVSPTRRPGRSLTPTSFEPIGIPPQLPTTPDQFNPCATVPTIQPRRPAGDTFAPFSITPWDWTPNTETPFRLPNRARLDTTVYPGEWPQAQEPYDWNTPQTPKPAARRFHQPTTETRPPDDPIPVAGTWAVPTEQPRRRPRPAIPYDSSVLFWVLPLDWITPQTDWPRGQRRRTQPDLVPVFPSFQITTDWIPPTTLPGPVPRTRPAGPDGTVAPPGIAPFDLTTGFDFAQQVYQRPRPRSVAVSISSSAYVWFGNPTPPVITGDASAYWIAEGGLRIWNAGGGGNMGLVKDVITKESGDTVRLGIDWGEVPEIVAGATLSSVTVSATPSGLTLSSQQNDTTYRTSLIFAGGSANTTYSVVWSATLSNGSVITRTAPLQVI